MFDPATMFNVSVEESATTSPCPATAIVLKILLVEPDAFIVNVSPTIAVDIPVPPATVKLSLTTFAVLLPVSAVNVAHLGASFVIVSVSPTTAVPIPVPPAIVKAESVALGVAVPLSLTTVTYLFALFTAKVIVSAKAFVVKLIPLPSAKVSVSVGVSAVTVVCPAISIF